MKDVTSVKDNEKATMYVQVVIIVAVLAALVALGTFQEGPTPNLQQAPGSGGQQQQEASPQP